MTYLTIFYYLQTGHCLVFIFFIFFIFRGVLELLYYFDGYNSITLFSPDKSLLYSQVLEL